MIITGVYWAARRESREEVAKRLSSFLGALTAVAHEPALREWFLTGSSRASARTRLPTDAASIAAVLSTNRRDLDGSVIPELGFGLSIWNGGDVSFGSTIGSWSARMTNAAVLSADDGALALNGEQWRALLEAAISAFEPDHGVVASQKQMMASEDQDPWAVGWFTYDSQHGIREHPEP